MADCPGDPEMEGTGLSEVTPVSEEGGDLCEGEHVTETDSLTGRRCNEVASREAVGHEYRVESEGDGESSGPCAEGGSSDERHTLQRVREEEGARKDCGVAGEVPEKVLLAQSTDRPADSSGVVCDSGPAAELQDEMEAHSEEKGNDTAASVGEEARQTDPQVGSITLTQEATTDVPPQEDTTDVPPQEDTTDVPPQEDTTDVPPQEDTTDVPPQEDTTDVPPQEDTTDVPPQEDTTDVPPQEDTTDVPPQEDTTDVPPQEDTTDVPPQEDTTDVPPQEDTTDVPPQEDTTDVPPQEDTTDVPPQEDTTDVPPQEDTTDVPPQEDTTDVPPQEDTTNVLPQRDAAAPMGGGQPSDRSSNSATCE